jgi:nicotinamide riboside kinase
MKIAISGAHSQGKTTLVKALQDSGLLSEYKFKTSLTRGLQEAGFNINENGDDVTQLMVMAKHYQFLKEKGDIVYDRCALDGYAYSKALLKEGRILNVINSLFSEMIDKYDIIFYVEPELPLIEDGQRTIDKDFFNEVVMCFNFCIETFCVPVVRLSGSVEQRVSQVILAIQDKEIEKHNNEFYEL